MNTFWFTVHRLFALPRCIVQFDLLPSPPCLSLLAVYSPPSGGAERDDSPPPELLTSHVVLGTTEVRDVLTITSVKVL